MSPVSGTGGGAAPHERGPAAPPESVAVTDLVRALEQTGVEVDTSSRRRAEYSFDASNYRVPPLAVAFPRNAREVRAAVLACRATGTPVVPRGGGTGMAGNAIGAGLVLDLSRYMTAIGAVDTVAGTIDVEPGVVLSELTTHVETVTGGRLTFAPDPSSRNRATVGGAIGNDACGNHSVRYGRTSHHVAELDLVTADGAMLTATRSGVRATDPTDRVSVQRAQELTTRLTELAERHRADLRVELGRIARQVSGYALHHLLTENGFDVARALVGSEGTCAIVVGARMSLVAKPASALLVCLGYADVVDAAADVTTILEYDPAAVEGIDDLILATMRWRRGDDAVVGMPRGGAWLYVDLDGDDPALVRVRAEELIVRLSEAGRLVEGKIVPDPVERAVLWRVREDGAGLSSRLAPGLVTGRPESWPGWEDSAVAPENLAAYLADFRTLLAEYGLAGVMYGHFGAGCMHVRINFDLRSAEGIDTFRRYLTAAAELVVRHGGSLSGEHGDGRARSALLPIMYPPSIMRAFAEFKSAWDAEGLLNPHQIVDPRDPASDLALDGVPRRDWATSLSFGSAGSSGSAGSMASAGSVGAVGSVGPGGSNGSAQVSPFVEAAQSCIGVGRCRTSSVGVMCPSYRATRDEKDSTRGRARVLQEMIRTAPSIEQGWRSDDVRDALDLCLSCKACSTDCPVGVDMASMRSEFFHHYYQGRLRPASHASLGRLPEWLALAGRIDRLTGGRALAAANGLLAVGAAGSGALTGGRALAAANGPLAVGAAGSGALTGGRALAAANGPLAVGAAGPGATAGPAEGVARLAGRALFYVPRSSRPRATVRVRRHPGSTTAARVPQDSRLFAWSPVPRWWISPTPAVSPDRTVTSTAEPAGGGFTRPPTPTTSRATASAARTTADPTPAGSESVAGRHRAFGPAALAGAAVRGVMSLAMRVAGLTDRRTLPPFAAPEAWIEQARLAGAERPGSATGDVLLLVDTFTRAFRPHLAGSATAVLAGAGDAVESTPDVCCGLTYISTGRLDEARRRLAHAAETLDGGQDDARPIVVVEPSCAAALRHDLPRLVHTDQAQRVAARVRSFAAAVDELGATGRLAPPSRPLPPEVVVQGHCHEYATFGAATQRRALAAATRASGGDADSPAPTDIHEAVGCCGVAGNFGFEADHYDVSVKVAQQALIPAIEATDDAAPVLTDGFSCAMQVDHVAPARRTMHLAELLDPRPTTP